MIAHSVRKGKKMINPHDFWFLEKWVPASLWQRRRNAFISLFIAPQTLSCAPCRKDLHNLLLRVTMRQTQMRKRFPSWAGENHRFWAGSVFDHINDHRQLRNTCETQIYRYLKSSGNRLKSTEKHHKSPEKIFSHCLGAGCRRFESCHSDQLSSKSRLLGGFSALIVRFSECD